MKTCEWVLESGWDCHIWKTSCGEDFLFNSGTPSENYFNYCCFCGEKLVECIPSEDLED